MSINNMPLISASHESLPYIDRPPSPASLAAAQSLISAELAPSSTLKSPHPSLPPPPFYPSSSSSSPSSPPLPNPSSLAPPTPLTSIDSSRYEDVDSSTPLPMLKIASVHLSSRLLSMALLEKHGRNAWLVGNAQLAEVLRAYEEELVRVREEAEEVNRQRKRVQEGKRAELEGGERAWREGVEGLIKVGVGGLDLEGRG